MDIKRIGTLAASTVMLGAALTGPVSAGMDSTGLDGSFFYDADYSPVAQIVVGEKVGNALDFVAAGNIAATVGNLAYMESTEDVTGGTAEGEVIISSSAIGATGDYVQDTQLLETLEEFYDKDDGFNFDSGEVTYERGDFTQYSLACEQQTRTEAAVLMEGEYSNVHCLFCQTLCLEALENPSHEMKEKITVDYDNIAYYEDGLNDDDSEDLRMAITEKDSIVYTIEAGFIPMKKITEDVGGGAEDYIDFEYRGKMILFGEEYYVREIDGSTKIYLSQGKVLDGISSEGYTAEYNGYKFKIDHLIYSAEYEVAGILLDVEKPDGTVVQTQISKMANGQIDDMEISGVYAEEADALASASIIVYDTTSDVLLEDGEDIELGGTVWDDWSVEFTVVSGDGVDGACDAMDGADPAGPDCDISEYDEMDEDQDDALLQQITVTYDHKLDGAEALEVDESLEFPGGRFKLTFKGFLTNDFRESSCVGDGEGNIVVERGDEDYQIVVSFTGDDNNRYDDVRLDEGPFGKGNMFVIDGTVYTYDKYKAIDNTDGDDSDDQVKVTLDPVIRGNRQKITLDRLCDPEDEEGTAAGCDFTTTFCDCEDIPEEITVRTLALTDAMDDDDDEDMENDDEIEIGTEDLFYKENAINGLLMLYDGSKLITFADNLTDLAITVNANMVGTLDDFDVDEHKLDLWVVEEGDKYTDINSTGTLAGADVNADGDDDDTLIYIQDDNGERVVIDLCDRDYDEDDTWDYNNAVGMYEQDCNCTVNCAIDTCVVDDVIVLEEDADTMLIAPDGGNTYSLDWGTDNRIDSVDICHPRDDVDATVFLGTEEEETLAEYTITKDDVGTEKEAACCRFKVEDFAVTGTAGGSVSTVVVNPVGNLVVSESAADGTKNLVLVGGPAVNAMTEAAGVTSAEIDAATDKYVVKKVDNTLVVAGWEADDTVAGANALISWLKANAH